MSTTVSAARLPSPPSLSLRMIRAVAGGGLAWLSLLALLLVGGYQAVVRGRFPTDFLPSEEGIPDVGIGLLLIALTPCVALAFAARKRWFTRLAAIGGVVATIPILVWLAWDEPPSSRLPSTEQLWPTLPGDEKSFSVLMQYSKKAPSAEAKAYAAVKFAVTWGAARPREREKWCEFVTTQRAGIEADWEKLAPQRRWLEELAAFDRIGDLTAPRHDADIMAFQVWRTLWQRACAIATLQALDGRGDDAIATLLPLLHVVRRLQPNSRTLIRSMIAVAMERMTLETIALVLDLSPVSSTQRTALERELAPEIVSVPASRIVQLEYPFIGSVLEDMKLGNQISAGHEGRKSALTGPLNALTALFFNPHATANLYHEHLQQLGQLADARALDQFAERTKAFEATVNAPGLKNFIGRYVLRLGITSFQKVIEAHWDTVDLRATLRKRLAEATAD
jgi:hypothetical protein